MEASKYAFPCQILSEKNGGVSRARNIGMNHATGDYVMFLDVDDLITEDRVEYMDRLLRATGADIVLTSSRTVFANDVPPNQAIPVVQPDPERISDYNRLEILRAFLQETVHTGVWGGAMRRAMIQNNHLHFVEGLKYSEDLHFLWQVFACCEKTVVSNRITHHYVWVPGSAMSKFGTNRLSGYEEIRDLAPFMHRNAPDFAPAFEKYAAARVLWSIVRQGAVYLSYRDWRRFFSKVDVRRSMRNLLSYSNRLVSASSACYLLLPLAFFWLSRAQARSNLNTRTDVAFE
jgi:glycosyltransferase involved in cell wall biosynthesis